MQAPPPIGTNHAPKRSPKKCVSRMGSSVQFGTTGADNFQRPSGHGPDGTHFYSTPKVATFIYSRWAQFVQNFGKIDDAVARLVKNEPDVKLRLHLGGAYFVSVTTGFRCVDIRKFYVTPGGNTKATKTGFAIPLSEWRLSHVRVVTNCFIPNAGQRACWRRESNAP